MDQIDAEKLVQALFESIQYDHTTDKRSFFEFMQQLIDQIYGVDNQVVKDATERFPVNMPKHFDSKHRELVGNTRKEKA